MDERIDPWRRRPVAAAAEGSARTPAGRRSGMLIGGRFQIIAMMVGALLVPIYCALMVQHQPASTLPPEIVYAAVRQGAEHSEAGSVGALVAQPEIGDRLPLQPSGRSLTQSRPVNIVVKPIAL